MGVQPLVRPPDQPAVEASLAHTRLVAGREQDRPLAGVEREGDAPYAVRGPKAKLLACCCAAIRSVCQRAGGPALVRTSRAASRERGSHPERRLAGHRIRDRRRDRIRRPTPWSEYDLHSIGCQGHEENATHLPTPRGDSRSTEFSRDFPRSRPTTARGASGGREGRDAAPTLPKGTSELALRIDNTERVRLVVTAELPHRPR